MDATRLRTLIEAAMDAQRAHDAAIEAETQAHKDTESARELCRKEVGNLYAAITETGIAFGDKFVRVENSAGGKRLIVVPLVSVPLVAPLPAPLPEAVPVEQVKRVEQPKVMVPQTAPNPLSGGSVPATVKKPAGK